MKEQVEAFIANLLDAGFKGERLSEKAYEYALALQTSHLPVQEGNLYIPPDMMARAAELVKDALPGAYRIVERRHMSR